MLGPQLVEDTADGYKHKQINIILQGKTNEEQQMTSAEARY